MSNLINRVQKAKQLQFTVIPGIRGAYSTTGSKGDRYQVRLFSENEKSKIGNKTLNHKTFYARCEMIKPNIQNSKASMMKACQGNSRHTVCYHCLGAIRWSLAQNNITISFTDTLIQAIRLQGLGGEIVRVVSEQGNGILWAVIKREIKVSDSPIVNLMRGDINDEGID